MTRRDDFEAALAQAKRESTLQVLFKVARVLDECAVSRLAAKKDAPHLRRAHTSLLPHVALAGTRITELADKLGISKQAVSQLVDDLEALDVVNREPDPDDARAKRVVFTKRGRAAMFEGLAVLVELERELGALVGEKTMNRLRDALLAVHDELDALRSD